MTHVINYRTKRKESPALISQPSQLVDPLTKARAVAKVEEQFQDRIIGYKPYNPFLLGHSAKQTWPSIPSSNLVKRAFPQFDDEDLKDFVKGYEYEG